MRKWSIALALLLLLSGCGAAVPEDGPEAASYVQIDAETASVMMEEEGTLILDVREQEEYDEGHIPEAVLLPVGTIDETTAAAAIPDKTTTVLVYCRSGNRSRTASQTLAELGYTAVYEFGGIRDWPYEVVTD